MEEFDPDPFMDELNTQGLPWKVIVEEKNDNMIFMALEAQELEIKHLSLESILKKEG